MFHDKASVAHAIGAFFLCLPALAAARGIEPARPPRVTDYFAARRLRVSSMPSAIDA